MTNASEAWQRACLFAAVALLLGLYATMAITASRHFGPVVDEPGHLIAGYLHWHHGDFRFAPENGNFPQSLAALPLIVGRWVEPYNNKEVSLAAATAWGASFDWFFRQGNNPDQMLLISRSMIVLIGAACGLVVFLWARKLSGDLGGLLALTLFVFCPTMLAHGSVVTSDMASAFGFLVATAASWALLHRVSLWRILLCGTAVALLALSKFSAPIVVFVIISMAAVRLLRGPVLAVGWPFKTNLCLTRRCQFLRLAGAFISAAGVAVALIWASYGFRFSMYPAAAAKSVRVEETRQIIAESGGMVEHALQWGLSRQILPEGWLVGLETTLYFSKERSAFLNGEYRTTGWWYFFPYVIAVKTLPAVFGLLALAIIAIKQKTKSEVGRLGLYDWTPLVSLFVVYGGVCAMSHLNIGQRHILPIYPVLFIVAGASLQFSGRIARIWRLGAWALLLWAISSSLLIRPNYLSYFNFLAGGPAEGWRHLIDSSVDWGQDLPALRSWLDQHPTEQPIFLSYVGADDPVFRGITATRVADRAFDHRAARKFPAIMKGGIYAVSVNSLQQVYNSARGPWDEEKERHYHSLLEKMRQTIDAQQVFSSELRQELEDYQFARLCNLLRERRPVGRAGWSILIFRLNDDEVVRALYSRLLPL